MSLYAHLLAGVPDLDLPWDLDLQQEVKTAQQESQWHAYHHIWDSKVYTKYRRTIMLNADRMLETHRASVNYLSEERFQTDAVHVTLDFGPRPTT